MVARICRKSMIYSTMYVVWADTRFVGHTMSCILFIPVGGSMTREVQSKQTCGLGSYSGHLPVLTTASTLCCIGYQTQAGGRQE